MPIDYNELFKALEKIKKACLSTIDCSNCPMGDLSGTCLVRDSTPEKWSILEPKSIVRVMK